MSTNPTPSPNEAARGHGAGGEAEDAGDLFLPHTLIDLGRQKRRAIADLEHGYGELGRDLAAHAIRICDEMSPDEPGDIVPVVIVYRCVDDVPPEGRGDGIDGDLE